jgi:hypothetical protein
VGRKELETIAQIKLLAALLYLDERLGHIRQKGGNDSERSSTSLKATAWGVEDLGSWRPEAQGKSPRAGYHPADGCQDGENGHFCHGLGIDNQECTGKNVGCKSHLVASMIEMISTIPDRATLLWPLFVLGNAGLESEEQRRFVLDRLANVQKINNLGSVRRTIDAVKHAFLTKSLISPSGRAWGHERYRYISLA